MKHPSGHAHCFRATERSGTRIYAIPEESLFLEGGDVLAIESRHRPVGDGI